MVDPKAEEPTGVPPTAEDTEAENSGVQLPADPDAYDSPRGVQARARGLSAPYIAGGTDPNPETGLREERHYLQILLVMVVMVVLSGFVLGYLAQALGFPT